MRSLLAVLLLVASIGCDGTGNDVIQTNAPSPESQMESLLTTTAQTGQPLGSGGMTLLQGINSIRERDPAKADALLEDYKKLISTTNQAAVRSAAQTMLDRL